MINKILALFDKIDAFAGWNVTKRYNFVIAIIIVVMGALITERNSKVLRLEVKLDNFNLECRKSKDILREQIQTCNDNLFNYISASEKEYRKTMFEVWELKKSKDGKQD